MSDDHYIFIGGDKVPVDEAVYRAFMRSVWAEKWRKQNRAKHEESLDALIESGVELESSGRLVDEIVEDRLLLEMLCLALRELTDDERVIIDALFSHLLRRQQARPIATQAFEVIITRKTWPYM